MRYAVCGMSYACSVCVCSKAERQKSEDESERMARTKARSSLTAQASSCSPCDRLLRSIFPSRSVSLSLSLSLSLSRSPFPPLPIRLHRLDSPATLAHPCPPLLHPPHHPCTMVLAVSVSMREHQSQSTSCRAGSSISAGLVAGLRREKSTPREPSATTH